MTSNAAGAATPLPPEQTDLLTVPEVAMALRTHPATVRRWITDGSLPAIKLGRDYRVEREQLDALVQRSRTSQPLTVSPRAEFL